MAKVKNAHNTFILDTGPEQGIVQHFLMREIGKLFSDWKILEKEVVVTLCGVNPQTKNTRYSIVVKHKT